jgi:tRNA-binding EMAP/Myf-like protein
MELIKSKVANINYLAKIVNISSFYPHPNADKLKCCTVDGFNIITDINSEEGMYIYFPALSQINNKFLSFANLYRHSNLNRNIELSGFFEDNGRVSAIKLRGIVSEGFIIPLKVLEEFLISIFNSKISNIKEGLEFNSVRHYGSEICLVKKYIAKQRTKRIEIRREEKKEEFNKIINSQFRFHYDSVIIKKYPNVISPDSLIHISSKIHGTSGISAYVLCKQKLNWKQKIAKWLTGEEFYTYDYVYASRTVIRNIDSDSVWHEADKVVRPKLSRGQSAYYEIVGFLPNGNYIQKDYDYGCIPPSDKYIPEVNFKVRIYRVTETNVDGEVFEYSPRQVQQWCNKVGLIPVTELYYGKAIDLYGHFDNSESFIEELSQDKNFYMEMNSPDCVNKVPHEGIVIKIDDGIARAFKLKTFAFLNKEQVLLDKGEENIEDES